LRLSDRAVRFGLKPLVFLASLGPLAYLIWAALTGHLSANPLADLTNETGVWTLRFICLTLAITPLRKVTGWNAPVKTHGRSLRLFYGTLHLLTYAIVDRFGSGSSARLGGGDHRRTRAGRSLMASTARGWRSRSARYLQAASSPSGFRPGSRCCRWRSPRPLGGFAGSVANAGIGCTGWC
jgi:hypothetical protein